MIDSARRSRGEREIMDGIYALGRAILEGMESPTSVLTLYVSPMSASA